MVGRGGTAGVSTWLRGKPGSPGIAKLLSSAMFWTSFCASLLFHARQHTSISSHAFLLISSMRKAPRQPRAIAHLPGTSDSPFQFPISNAFPPTPKQKRSHSPRIHVRPNLPQTLTNPQNPINQQPIRRTLDLKIPEECIRPEQTQNLI
jgi:hypothetical protein